MSAKSKNTGALLLSGNDPRRLLASAQASLASARKRLAEQASDGADWPDVESLAKTVNDVADWAGVVSVYAHVVDIIDGGGDLADARMQVARMLTHGPDDTWSGRCNDVRRAMYDGRLSATQTVLGY